MVEELIREDPALARTVLIIEQDDGKIHYSPQFTMLKILLDWKHSVSGVKDDELSQIVVGQEDNRMITGEDVQEVIKMLEIDLNDRTYMIWYKHETLHSFISSLCHVFSVKLTVHYCGKQGRN